MALVRTDVGRAAGSGGLGALPSRLWRSRALFRSLYRRELTVRYVGSLSGLLWVLLQPLALLLAYHFVFATVFKVGTFAGQSFLSFVAVGMWPWLAAQEGLLRATGAVQAHAGLVKKVAFPHEILVAASVAATFTAHFTGYVVILAVLLAFGEPITLSGLPAAALLWTILLVAVLGLGLVFAAMQVFVRDVEHGLAPILMVAMYLAPVLYPLAAVPATLRGWVAANPFTHLVQRLREALLEGSAQPAAGDLVAAAIALALLGAGYWIFRRLSPHFEDFL